MSDDHCLNQIRQSEPPEQQQQRIWCIPFIVYRISGVCILVACIFHLSGVLVTRNEIIIIQQGKGLRIEQRSNSNNYLESDLSIFWIPEYAKVHTYHYDPSTKESQVINHEQVNYLSSCIVSAYFQLERSKHTSNQYIEEWIPNFVSLQDDCMIIFCSNSTTLDQIYKHRLKKFTIESTFFVEIKLHS